MDSMEIGVSIETQQANDNLRTIIASLVEMGERTNEASAAIGGLEQSLGKIPAIGNAASTSIGGIGTAAKTSAGQVTEAKASIVTDLNEVKDKTDEAKEASEAAKTSTGSWLGAYAGVGAAIAFIGQIKSAMQETLDVQNELVNKKFSQDIIIRHVMSDLHLEGDAGQKIARDLMEKIMDAAPGHSGTSGPGGVRRQLGRGSIRARRAEWITRQRVQRRSGVTIWTNNRR